MDKNKTDNNLLKFPYRSKITDAEITSLFLGLCRLVKNQALEEARLLTFSESKKNKALEEELAKKNKEIEMLKMINYQLKKRIDKNLEAQFK